jgi:hypothetical protein
MYHVYRYDVSCVYKVNIFCKYMDITDVYILTRIRNSCTKSEHSLNE